MAGKFNTNNHEHNAKLLSLGNEKGLAFFYDLHAKGIYYRVFRATGDICEAETIVQESFLKLWILRCSMDNADQVAEFLRKFVKASINDFFSFARYRFDRSMLRIDGMEGFDRYLSDPLDEGCDEKADFDIEQIDVKQQMAKVNAVLPSLCAKQRLFIDLCLRYSFSYERISAHIGGISEYAVANNVGKIIAKLRGLLVGIGRLDTAQLTSKVVISGSLSEQQQDILRIRHELGLTFEEIAQKISLSPTEVRRLFLQAHHNNNKKTG